MAKIDFNKLVSAVKKGAHTHASACDALGCVTSDLNSLVFSKALVEAGVASKLARITPAQVRNLRDKDKERWELIAARTGKSVAEIKDLYEQAGGDSSARLRGAEGSGARTTARRGAGGKTAGAKRSGVKVTASKRGAAKTKTAGTKRKTAVIRRTTRRGRSAANPS